MITFLPGLDKSSSRRTIYKDQEMKRESKKKGKRERERKKDKERERRKERV